MDSRQHRRQDGKRASRSRGRCRAHSSLCRKIRGASRCRDKAGRIQKGFHIMGATFISREGRLGDHAWERHAQLGRSRRMCGETRQRDLRGSKGKCHARYSGAQLNFVRQMSLAETAASSKVSPPSGAGIVAVFSGASRVPTPGNAKRNPLGNTHDRSGQGNAAQDHDAISSIFSAPFRSE
jgi:hypothetical protein